MSVGGEQGDQMARLFINIWQFVQNEFAKKHAHFGKVGSKFGQIQDRLSETMPETF